MLLDQNAGYEPPELVRLGSLAELTQAFINKNGRSRDIFSASTPIHGAITLVSGTSDTG